MTSFFDFSCYKKSRGSVPENNDRRGLSRGNHESDWNGLDEWKLFEEQYRTTRLDILQ